MWGRESVRTSKCRLISQSNDKKTLIWSSPPLPGSRFTIRNRRRAPTYVPLPDSADPTGKPACELRVNGTQEAERFLTRQFTLLKFTSHIRR
jgi:hypothetical protein